MVQIIPINNTAGHKVPQSYGKHQIKAYWAILHRLGKTGETPISLQSYNECKKEFYKDYKGAVSNYAKESIRGNGRPDRQPFALSLHGSYVPLHETFIQANKKYWDEDARYKGYNVSIDMQTGEKVLFRLAEKLRDENGNEIAVADARDHIILTKIYSVNGKSSIAYERDTGRNETWVYPDPNYSTCVTFPTQDGWYELRNGIFVKSNISNPDANYLRRAYDANWNGIFAAGSDAAGYFDIRNLMALHTPSYGLVMLVQETGAIAVCLSESGQQRVELQGVQYSSLSPVLSNNGWFVKFHTMVTEEANAVAGSY